MGKKRSHSEANASENNNANGGSRNREKAKKPSKRQKVDASAENIGAIKKRARALERLFSKDNSKIPADKQMELERELAAHKKRIAEAAAKKHRSEMIGKYHMVRFFERKKATRLAKQLKRKLDETEDPEESAKLQADLHIAEVDIDYAKYHPFLENYISLYPSRSEKGEEDEEKPKAAQYLHTPRPPMWTTIEKLREEGQDALEKLQNRQPEASQDDKTSVKKSKKRAPVKAELSKTKPDRNVEGTSTKDDGAAAQGGKTGAAGVMNRRERRLAERNATAKAKEQENDSDGGGFFEE